MSFKSRAGASTVRGAYFVAIQFCWPKVGTPPIILARPPTVSAPVQNVEVKAIDLPASESK